MVKMLIADDEQLIRESLAQCIDWQARGIEVVGCCKNGIEALDAILDTNPDLVLTDIRMPGLTGLELIEKIRERDRDTELIIISGHKEFDYAKKAIQFGVTDYLLKPVNEAMLLEAVENAVRRHREKARVKTYLAMDEARPEEGEAGPVPRLKKYVAEHYADPGLTLKWVAENVLYMNVDYLSRKFVSETGEKFSAFLTRTRMEHAKELLPHYGKEGVQAVAERVGCGNSQRYFSQMFKKYTGLTPPQYVGERQGRLQQA